jgi:hypothetical protein
LDFFPSSGILENRKNDVSEFGFVSVLKGRGKKISTQLGPVKRANFNHWTPPVRFTQLFNHFETRLFRREARRKYTIKISIRNAHAWSWDAKGR